MATKASAILLGVICIESELRFCQKFIYRKNNDVSKFYSYKNNLAIVTTKCLQAQLAGRNFSVYSVAMHAQISEQGTVPIADVKISFLGFLGYLYGEKIDINP